MKFSLFFMLTLIGAATYCTGQEIDRDYIEKNLPLNKYQIDSEASAIVLYEHTDIKITEEYNVYIKKDRIHKVIKILNSDVLEAGPHSIANVNIFLPKQDVNHYVSNIRATTYNLNNGMLVESELKKQDIFNEKHGKESYKVAFSLPAVKVGSIIEYSYEKVTKFTDNLIVWYIQEEYPKLTSEFEITYTDQFIFTSIAAVRSEERQFKTRADARNSDHDFCYVKNTQRLGNVYYSSFWTKKNIPVVRKEHFVNNVHSMEDRIEIQLTGVKLSSGNVKQFNNSWKNVNKTLWKDGNIKRAVNGSNNFLDDIIDSLTRNVKNETEKTKIIYDYVRRSMARKYSKTFSGKKRELTEVFKNHNGNPAEINMLLTAMLVHAGVSASPVLISPTYNLPFSRTFPVLSRIGEIVCIVNIEDKSVVLDASDKNNCFGILPDNCYNGFAWVLGNEGYGIDLSPELKRDKTINAFDIHDFTDSTAYLDLYQKIGKYRSQNLRKKWDNNTKRIDQYTAEIEDRFPIGAKVLEKSILNIDNPDTNLIVKYTCLLKFDKSASAILITTDMMQPFQTNLFTQTGKRILPIEFPYKIDYSSHTKISLPTGYQPDSLPKPMLMTVANNGITYKKNSTYFPSYNTLTINTAMEANAAVFDAGEYSAIKDFLGKVIEENDNVISINKPGK